MPYKGIEEENRRLSLLFFQIDNEKISSAKIELAHSVR